MKWEPIETAPIDVFVDVWVKSKNNPDYNRRACSVLVRGDCIAGSDAPDPRFGEYATHWMIVTAPDDNDDEVKS